jgi:hypothetical protein
MKQELNEQRPGALYERVYRELAALEQPGWQRYVERHQPTLHGELMQAETRFDVASHAMTAEDFEWRNDAAEVLTEFKEALEQWRQASLKAIQYYNNHQPPTIAGPDPDEVAQTRERLAERRYIQVWSDELREHLFFISNDLDRLNKWVPENVKKVAIGLQELRLQQGSITDRRGLAILAVAKRAGLI